MSFIGKEISDFKVQSFINGEFKEVTKKDVLGKWSVFFFYPADFTFVCPTELEELADKYEDFKKIGCEIYSVSCDTHFVHKAWHDVSKTIKKINYPMLADPTGALARFCALADIALNRATPAKKVENFLFIINKLILILVFIKIINLLD